MMLAPPASFPARPLRAEIDLAAARHNLAVVRRLCPQAQVLAVVKADAYGHGLRPMAQAWAEADGLAVLNLQEAQCLREQGERRPIVLLEGLFAAQEWPQALALDVTVVLHAAWQWAMLDGQQGEPRQVALKFNTGMNRLGLPIAELALWVARVQQRWPKAEIILLTHFANADMPEGVAQPLADFLAQAGAQPWPLSMANSAAILLHPATRVGWVRPGIMLYGASPSSQAAQTWGLQAVMHLRSALIAVQCLQAGDAVGYGATFVAPQAMRIGIVACGYADGYPRQAGTGTPVLVQGQRSQLLGRVSMDMLAVDLRGLDGAEVGAEVTLWGPGLPVDEVARAAQTIGYSLLAGVTARVPRVYLPA